MRKIFLSVVASIIISCVHAQLCNTVKPGMTKKKVLELAGAPSNTAFIGIDNGTDSLLLWNYGNQQIAFSGNQVNKIIYDFIREQELIMQFSDKKITKEELAIRLEKVNKEACK